MSMQLRMRLARVRRRLAYWLFRILDDRFRMNHLRVQGAVEKMDIFYAYRLLLGRAPEPEGWRSYCAMRDEMTHERLLDAMLNSHEFRSSARYYNLLDEHGRAQPKLIDVGTFQQFVDSDDQSIGAVIERRGVWEPHLTAHLKPLLQAGMTFLDVGANIGYHSLLAAERVGAGGSVIAVEANPHNCNLLQISALVNGFDWLDIYPLAAAEKNSSFVFQQWDGSNGAIVEELTGENDAETLSRLAQRTIVRAMPLDTLLADLSRLDVIKIDIEGAEFRALRGMRSLLERFRPIIFSEFSPLMLQSNSLASGEQYLQLLVELGYDIAVIDFADHSLSHFGDDIAGVMQHLDAAPEPQLDLMLAPR